VRLKIYFFWRPVMVLLEVYFRANPPPPHLFLMSLIQTVNCFLFRFTSMRHIDILF
jgi:hypothetical protein